MNNLGLLIYYTIVVNKFTISHLLLNFNQPVGCRQEALLDSNSRILNKSI